MTQNFDKTWFQSSANRAAIKRAQAEIDATGKGLPCVVKSVSGSIVTVTFEVASAPYVLPNVTIPKAESQWIRSPTQPGDYGLTIPSAVYLGGVSGLGGGQAKLSLPANLCPLVWVPVASTAFPAANVNAALVEGPQGAIIQTQDGSVSITVEAGQIVLKAAGKTWAFGSAGLTLSNGIVTETHIHDDPQGGVTSGPLNP